MRRFGAGAKVLTLLMGPALVGAVACAKARSVRPDAAKARQQARQLMEAGDDAGAEKAWRRASALHEKAGAFAEAARDAYEVFRLRYDDADKPHLALEQVHRAWSLAQRTDDRALKRQVLKGAFAILYFVGDLKTCQQAVDDYKALVDPDDTDAASIWNNNAALVDMGAGRYQTARRRLQRASAADAVKYPGDPSYSILANLVDVNLELGDAEAAQRHLASLVAAHGLGDDAKNPVTVLLKVRVANALGKHEEALRWSSKALKAEPELAWSRDLCFEEGRAYEALGRQDDAIAAYERSIAYVEKLRRQIQIDDFKPASIARHRRPFEALFTLHLARDDDIAALQVVDRAQGRTFLDALYESPDDPAEVKTGPSLERSRQIAQGLLQLLPELRRSASRRPLEITKVLDGLGSHHLSVYFKAGQTLWVGLVFEGKVRFSRATTVDAKLVELIAKLRADIDEPNTAAALGQRLLKADRLSPSGQVMVIVPDTVVLDVPFSQLRMDGRRLVQLRDLAYLPSLSSMSSALERVARHHPIDPPVVIGAGNLAGATAEAQWVASHFDVDPSIDASATLDALRQGRNASFIHVASHAGVGLTQPWLALHDGEVFPSTIMALGLQPRFVVLSSCTSGVAKGQQTWGSLAAAFFAAGADGVMASRWAIDDETTLRFIREFYRAGGAKRPRAALARTQRAWINAKEPPATWAAFYYLGVDPKPLTVRTTAVDKGRPR